MLTKMIFFLLTLLPQIVMAQTLSCNTLFTLRSNNPPVRTESRIEFHDSNTYKILRAVNRIFSEYPKGYMENTKTVAKVTVPESRWFHVFDQDYETVIAELSKAKIYEVEIYEDGTQAVVAETDLLISFRNDELKFFPNEWVTTQRSFSFQFDRRILRLMEMYVEPAHVGIVLQNGVIDRSPRPHEERYFSLR